MEIDNKEAIEHIKKYYLNKLEHDKAYKHPTKKHDRSINVFKITISALERQRETDILYLRIQIRPPEGSLIVKT